MSRPNYVPQQNARIAPTFKFPVGQQKSILFMLTFEGKWIAKCPNKPCHYHKISMNTGNLPFFLASCSSLVVRCRHCFDVECCKGLHRGFSPSDPCLWTKTYSEIIFLLLVTESVVLPTCRRGCETGNTRLNITSSSVLHQHDTASRFPHSMIMSSCNTCWAYSKLYRNASVKHPSSAPSHHRYDALCAWRINKMIRRWSHMGWKLFYLCSVWTACIFQRSVTKFFSRSINAFSSSDKPITFPRGQPAYVNRCRDGRCSLATRNPLTKSPQPTHSLTLFPLFDGFLLVAAHRRFLLEFIRLRFLRKFTLSSSTFSLLNKLDGFLFEQNLGFYLHTTANESHEMRWNLTKKYLRARK